MSVADTLARPYARAVFEIAIKNNNIEEWKNSLIVMNQIASCEKIKNFLSGALSPKYLSLIFIKISHDMITKYAKNFIKLLAEKQRFEILNNILKQFLQLEADYKKILIIELITAYSLQETEMIRIKKILEQFFSRKIKLLYKVNPHIISGIIIKNNDIVFDFSVANNLNKLSAALNV